MSQNVEALILYVTHVFKYKIKIKISFFEFGYKIELLT